MNESKSIENMSFEEALIELEEIVKKIDSGDETLEHAVSSFERGMALKLHCENKLKEAQMKIQKITKLEDGQIEISDINI